MTFPIAHMIPYTGRAQGGPVFGLASMAAGLADRGMPVSVLSVALDDDGEQIRFDPRVAVATFPASRSVGFRRSPGLWKRAERLLEAVRNDAGIIHSHSLWTDINRMAATLARRYGVPHVLSPCGTLAGEALSYRGWKKIPARLWFQDRALHRADCLHAKSEKERDDIRAYGLRNPVAVIPNAVDDPPASGVPSAAEFRERFNLPGDKRIVLYMGRIHPVKGLSRLIEAWSLLSALRNDWLLVLAGPDEAGHKTRIDALIEARGCGGSVAFTGGLNDAWKWGAYNAAELFVMPSDFENFGTCIVEAMMAATPVITTTGTPWKILPEKNAGWWVAPDELRLADALEAAMSLSEKDRHAMGANARDLAGDYTTSNIAGQLVGVYEWLLGSGPQPECVTCHE